MFRAIRRPAASGYISGGRREQAFDVVNQEAQAMVTHSVQILSGLLEPAKHAVPIEILAIVLKS